MAGSLNSKLPGEFAIDVRSQGGTAFVKGRGRLVFGNTDGLSGGVRGLLTKSKRVVVDLCDVIYIDSAGLGAVVHLYVSAKTSGCELQLLNLAPQVRQIFGLTRILSLFEPCGEHNIRLP